MSKLAQGETIGAYPYRIIKQLGKGEGGMSIVYLASIGDVDEPRAHELVAVKIANAESKHNKFYKDTLDNETEHLRKLSHPGIVHLHRIRGRRLPSYSVFSARTTLPGKPWFSVMEYLSGGSLAELLKREKKLDASLALHITHKLAKTLEYVHREKCVHLDIKPENVVFRQPITNSQSIDPVLIDFGIARKIGQGGLEAGTPIWLSPERLESKGLPPERMAKPHPSMDIYALGLLLYRMLAGRLPFQGSRQSITAAILRGHPTTPSTYNSVLKAELDQLVLSAMAKKPHDRPTAAWLARELEQLMNRPEYWPIKMPSAPNRKNGSLFTILISCLLTLGIGFGAFWYVNPQLLADLTTKLGGSTATPTITATTVPSTATRVPTIPVSNTERATRTRIPPVVTSTPVSTFTPIPNTAIPSSTVAPPTAAPVQPTAAPTQAPTAPNP